MHKHYDVLVIGSGTAGQTAAYRLNDSGMTVGMAEQSDRPGGTCALSGCQAKKWFYEGAETVARSRHLSDIGISSPAVARWADLRDAKNRFTADVPSNTINSLKKTGIDFIRGRARFTDKNAVRIGEHRITARFFVLAAGAVPRPLPIEGAGHMITSSQYMELEKLPPRIVFIGGGFISYEFAHFAVRLGPEGTRCTVLQSGPRPLKPFDEEMVSLLVKASALEGIQTHCNVEVTGIRKNGGSFQVATRNDGIFESDLVVNGTGRIPAISDLDLEKAGVDYTRKGITVDEKMTTTNPNVFAVGDCAATIQLARAADKEAHTAAAAILDLDKGRGAGASAADAVMDYSAVPAVLFTYPQYGMVGATEQTLKEKQIPFKKSFGESLSWPTYRRIGLRSAAFKVLTGEKGAILGAHILSDNATGLINTFTLAMTNRISAKTLYHQSIMTPYPSRESDIIYMLKPLIEN